jgi:hypothetical protein
VFEGKRLWPDEYIVSADEKTQLQALGRRRETEAPGPGRLSRYEFEYERGGTLAYLAAWDVHHANLFDRVEKTAGIEPFGRLVEQVMTSEPYASARTMYWIVDNGSSHAGKTSVKRMQDRWPNARLIHLPVNASWLNQIELYFSIPQRKALTPQRPPDHRRARRAGARLRRALTARPAPVQVDLHPPKTQRADCPDRPARTPTRARRLTPGTSGRLH